VSGTMGRRNLRSRAHLGALVAAVVLCGFGVVASSVASAQTPRGPAPGSRSAPSDQIMTRPDPPAIRASDQFVMTLRYNAGNLSLANVRRVHLPQPRTTPRNAGRFALELLSGPTLVERLRFDFPLIGADELAGQPRQYNAPPRFENRAVVTYDVMVPDSPRISRARLIDRATARVTPIAWPPDQQPDAGADAARRPADAGSTTTAQEIHDAGASDAPSASYDAAQPK
jgi:hypothetical protein